MFEKLRHILLAQDLEERQELSEKLQQLDKSLNSREDIEARISPVLDDQLGYLQQNFPLLFGAAVTESIKTQIRESQDEMVEALYPIIGKMIKKYIVKEMELLSERIDQQIANTFSWEGWLIRVKSWFGGVSQGEIIASQLIEPQIEEIFVIQQDSGLLLGSFSKNKTIDQDMIAGMLTAIKSFVGDAFSQGQQDLELIEYETYKLFLKNFKSFYIVAVVSGSMNKAFQNKLDDTILDFADKSLNKGNKSLSEEKVKGYLKEYFEN